MDYSDALLRAKAAIKQLERDLPNKQIAHADYQSTLLMQAARDLKKETLGSLIKSANICGNKNAPSCSG